MIRVFIICLLFTFSCASVSQKNENNVLTGADQTDLYFPLLANKRVGLTVNHSSLIEKTHLTDTILHSGINLTKVFTPEHGFKGTVSDGAKIDYDSVEAPYELISLYGKNKKPSKEQLKDLDVVVFDIQDVGTRFYTYISTMYYVMEACAENGVPVLILDRPNPNGSYVDGPVLETEFSSFVGIVPIPIVHGMTVGELARMFNEEGWLGNGVKCDLNVINMKNWNHAMPYSLPVKPSPNLPDDLSISLYPSLCLFEGTIMSVGRGTEYAFQQIGHPEYPSAQHSFTPVSREGAKWPPYEDLVCYGKSWIGEKPSYQFSLRPLIDAYAIMEREDFFNDYFKLLAGTDKLQEQIEAGMSEQEIRNSWEDDLTKFKLVREKYLSYK
ncbi:exo-beta-N-acetylmuramidase NamZ family protein [Ekhidna sp.]